MLETHAFENFIPNNITHLVLGSFVAKSISDDPDYDWYYVTKRNQFWSIIEEVYGIELPNKLDKVSLFESLGIGIADIIYQCERRDGNSADNNLKNIVYNPELSQFLKIDSLETIMFSSRFVEKLFNKAFGHLINDFSHLQLITLPSPSPRYAKMSKEEKIKRYKEVFPQQKLL